MSRKNDFSLKSPTGKYTKKIRLNQRFLNFKPKTPNNRIKYTSLINSAMINFKKDLKKPKQKKYISNKTKR